VPSLLGVWLYAGEVQGVGHGRIEAGFRTASAVVVLADEHLVLQQDLHRSRRRVGLEDDVREQVALVEAVEVDLEGAPHVRLVVRSIVERGVVDLDGAVVPGRIGSRGRIGDVAERQSNDEARDSREHPDHHQQTSARTPGPCELVHDLTPCPG